MVVTKVEDISLERNEDIYFDTFHGIKWNFLLLLQPNTIYIHNHIQICNNVLLTFIFKLLI